MTGTMPERGRVIYSATQPERSRENTLRALLQNMSASHLLPLQQCRIFNESEMTFQTRLDAREELYVLLFAAREFILDAIEIRVTQAKDWTPPSELISRQRFLQTRFLKWHSAFDDMINSPGFASTQNEIEPYSLLHVAYGHHFILLSTLLSMYETAFDKFLPIFQTMIDNASRIVATGRDELRPVFMFETRVIPTLFFIATKCRHPVIRRQAVSLLRSGAEIENTWKADPLADFAELTVGIEESGNPHGAFCPEPGQHELPPENSRVYRGQIIALPDSDGRPAKFHRFTMWQQDESLAWSLIEYTLRI